MAQAQLIQGTGAELIPYLEQRRNQPNLLLIIPEEENQQRSTPFVEEASQTQRKIFLRDGIPTLATEGAAQLVIMELVKRLAEQEAFSDFDMTLFEQVMGPIRQISEQQRESIVTSSVWEIPKNE